MASHLLCAVRANARKTLPLLVQLWLNSRVINGYRCEVFGGLTQTFVVKRCRMHIFYSGRVQGVGFRYTAKNVAMGFEVTGSVRNLPDGRVELLAEGQKEELEAFRLAIRESGLGSFISNEQITWGDPEGRFRGFDITG
jgi:acylphosphatase